MTDQLVNSLPGQTTFPAKLKDMGDGSFAEVLYIGGGSVATSGGNPSQVFSHPASNTIVALNGSVQWSVEGGSSYLISLTNSAAATTSWAATITFQYSINGGTTWQNLTALPWSTPIAQATTSATTNGLWLVNAPAGNSVLIQAIATAYTSGTIAVDFAPYGQSGTAILLPWNYTVTSGQTVLGPIDSTGFSEISLQITAITTTILTVQGTNDPSLTTWDTIGCSGSSANGSALTQLYATGTYRASVGSFKWVRVQCTTTGTVLTLTGIYGRLGTPTNQTFVIGNAVTTTTNIAQIGGVASPASAPNGSASRSYGVGQLTAYPQTDQNATAFAGAGSVVGTVVASTVGGGAVVSAEINVSALTLGTATAVFAILQESRGGTNFTDIWVSDPITTTGIISMPAIPVAGRRRWRFFSCGGTSTTVTVTISALELPSGYIVIRQMRDYYAANNPLALMFNSTALTASNFVLSTVSTATTPMLVEGCKTITAFMTLAGSPTVTLQPVVTLQLSIDGTNWWSTAATLTAAGNGTYMASVNNATAKFGRLLVTTAATYSAGSYTISNIGVQGVN